jgi:hypothetical protein
MGARETKAFAWGRKIPTPTVLLRLVGAMLGDDQRRRLGEVKYLPRHVIHRHRRAQWFATPGASLWIMIDDGVGGFGPAQRLARMALLPAGVLA